MKTHLFESTEEIQECLQGMIEDGYVEVYLNEDDGQEYYKLTEYGQIIADELLREEEEKHSLLH